MTSLQSNLSQAVDYHQAGDLDHAEDIYRQVLKDEPENPNALNLLGVLCSQREQFDESIDLLMKAVQTGDRFYSAHYNYAKALHAVNRLEEAEAQYRIAIEIDPNQASAHHNLGASLCELGRHEEAAESFREAVRIDPLHEEAWHQLAMILFHYDQHEGAIECWRCAIHANDRCLDYHHNLALVLQQCGQLDEAEAGYRKALQLNETSVSTWSNLATVLRELGRTDEAIECCREAIRIDPNYADAYNNLGNIHLTRGEAEEALRWADQAIQINPENTSALATAAGALQAACESDAVIDHLTEAIRINPKDPSLYVRRAEVLLNYGRPDEALADFEQAATLDSGCTRAGIGKAKVHLFVGQTEEAHQVLDPLTKAPHDDPEAVILLAALLQNQRQYEESVSLLEQRLETGNLNNSHRRRISYALGDGFDKLQRFDIAFEWYQQANQANLGTFDIADTERLFERIITTFTPEHLARLPRAQHDCEQGIFIVGMPRSGTTLIEQIMDSHPAIHGAGETNFFVPVFRELAELVDMRDFPKNLLNLTQDQTNQLGASCAGRLQELSAKHTRIIEKTPSNFRFLGLLQMLLPGSRVILCSRHPLDTCLSCYFHDFIGWHPYIYDLATLGQYYRLYERMVAHWRSVLDLDILEVKYEDLVADQEAVSRRIIEFAGVEWDDACLRFFENPRRVHSASAQQVREPIYTTSVARYRPYLAHLTPLVESLGLDAAEL